MSAEQHIKRLGAMKGDRAVHEDAWRSCFDVSFPLRGDGLTGTRTSAADARSKLAHRRDSTATDAGEQLAANLMGGLTPSNSRWFALDVGEETDEERRWLDDAASSMWENIHASNYDAAGYESCMDIVGAGWFALYIEEAEGGGYAMEPWPIGQCYVSSTRRDGRVDTLFREYSQTSAQLVARFGENGVSERVRRNIVEDKPDTKVTLLHVIEPRALHVAGARMARNMPFKSCTYEVESKHLLLESGYPEFPVVVPRWNVIPQSCYAVGPMFKALPDVEQLNRLVAMEDAAAELAVAGMWIAEDDGVLNPRTIKVGPRKVIVAASVDSMKPLLTGADFNVSFTKKELLQGQIRRALMADALQPQDGPAMTATEVHARLGLIRQMLGPTYGRLQAEWLQSMIERCFGIAWRAGALGTPPDTLQGRSFSIRYLSPMARAQKLEDVSGMDRHEAALIAEAEVRPDVLDTYDWDKASRHRAELLGVPSDLIPDARDVAKLRKAREEQAKAQQQEAMQANGQAEMQKAAGQRMAAL